METLGFAVIALGLVLFALVSARAQSLIVTPPMVFVLFGFVIGGSVLGLVDLNVGESTIHLLSELTLVLILFTDAARIDFKRLFQDHDIPVRMLLIGMPLTILAGTALAFPLFPEFNLFELALLATILTPTDAALGQATVSSPKVPLRIRQALNVESGLNDGIAVPVVVLFLCFANDMHGMESETPWLWLAILQITLGPLVGFGVGFAGGKLAEWCARHEWMTETFQGLSALGFAILAFAAAELIGGNGFIAAFVAGLTLGNVTHHASRALIEFAEAEGQLLALAIFLIFGAALAPMAVEHFEWRYLIYAVGALTVMRMVPVALSLMGSKLHRSTFLFLGWFGPRGLASIIFALLVLEELGSENAETILMVTIITVLLSIFAHGLTAVPFSNLYARTCSARSDASFEEEMKPVSEIPARFGLFHSRG